MSALDFAPPHSVARKLQTVTINALQSLPICDTCSPTIAERHRFENGLS